MNFDFEKLQAVAELGEVIRLQNEALELLTTFRRERPYLIVPNMAKMVEENLKENVHILYKEMNNMHKPPAQQKRHICRECSMGFAVALPGGICDECRANKVQGSARVLPPTPTVGTNDQSLEEMMAEAVREEVASGDSSSAETESSTVEGAVAETDPVVTEPAGVEAMDTIEAEPDTDVNPELPQPAVEEPQAEPAIEEPEPEPVESPVEEPEPAEQPQGDPESDAPAVEEPHDEKDAR